MSQFNMTDSGASSSAHPSTLGGNFGGNTSTSGAPAETELVFKVPATERDTATDSGVSMFDLMRHNNYEGLKWTDVVTDVSRKAGRSYLDFDTVTRGRTGIITMDDGKPKDKKDARRLSVQVTVQTVANAPDLETVPVGQNYWLRYPDGTVENIEYHIPENLKSAYYETLRFKRDDESEFGFQILPFSNGASTIEFNGQQTKLYSKTKGDRRVWDVIPYMSMTPILTKASESRKSKHKR